MKFALSNLVFVLIMIGSTDQTFAAKKVLSLKPSSVPAREYDFRGATLGMSLSDFRALPYPDVAGDSTAKVFCSDDPPLDVLSIAFSLDDTERKLGIVKCAYFTDYAHLMPQMQGWRQTSVAVGTGGYGAYDASYNFVKDPSDGTLKLYEITMSTNAKAWHCYSLKCAYRAAPV